MNESGGSAIEVVSEFMSPFEDSLTVVLLGDHITDEEAEDAMIAFDESRKNFNGLPKIGEVLGPIDHVRATSSDLFRGKLDDVIKKEACVIYMDWELSRDTINMLTNHHNEVDDLEAMLIEKYLLTVGQEKFIFNLKGIDDQKVQQLTDAMDARAGEFNYVIIENLLAIWIYDLDEFTFIQTD
jgi:hypothetical protein